MYETGYHATGYYATGYYLPLDAVAVLGSMHPYWEREKWLDYWEKNRDRAPPVIEAIPETAALAELKSVSHIPLEDIPDGVNREIAVLVRAADAQRAEELAKAIGRRIDDIRDDEDMALVLLMLAAAYDD